MSIRTVDIDADCDVMLTVISIRTVDNEGTVTDGEKYHFEIKL